jgi:3-methyladenine DNA glycosylase/8-oxoguanine DNA glycosylase
VTRLHIEGVAHLERADPVMRAIVGRVGPMSLRPPRRVDTFSSLARAIVFQQLSGKAAATIHGRFAALFDGRPTPERVLDAAEERLRGAGLSRAKVLAVRDLASATLDGRLALPLSRRLEDEAVVERLVTVRGIGPWTAHMFLIFQWGRPDVLPVADLGLRNAVRRAYGLRRDPTPERLASIAAPWRPFRSVATWYLWRSLDAAGATDPTS